MLRATWIRLWREYKLHTQAAESCMQRQRRQLLRCVHAWHSMAAELAARRAVVEDRVDERRVGARGMHKPACRHTLTPPLCRARQARLR
jgi:hypothetical protein